VELLAVIVVGGLLLFMVSARFPNRHRSINRVACVMNLRNVGIAIRTYAVDSEGVYPWQKVITVTGATNRFVLKVPDTNPVSADLIRYLWSLSNELSTPKIVMCPSEWRRPLHTNTWGHLQAHPEEGHRMPSYFLGLDASEERPESILAGDRNLTDGTSGPFRWNEVTEKTPVWNPASDPASLGFFGSLGFDKETIHKGGGNILFVDGSAQQLSSRRLRRAVAAASKAAPPAWLMPVAH
jgi:prepilin-type processing-associated H-X9-DG protein